MSIYFPRAVFVGGLGAGYSAVQAIGERLTSSVSSCPVRIGEIDVFTTFKVSINREAFEAACLDVPLITYSSGPTVLDTKNMGYSLRPSQLCLISPPDKQQSPVAYLGRAVKHYRDERKRPKPPNAAYETHLFSPPRKYTRRLFLQGTTRFDRVQFAANAVRSGIQTGILTLEDDRLHPLGENEPQRAADAGVTFVVHKGNPETGGHFAFLRQPQELFGKLALAMANNA